MEAAASGEGGVVGPRRDRGAIVLGRGHSAAVLPDGPGAEPDVAGAEPDVACADPDVASADPDVAGAAGAGAGATGANGSGRALGAVRFGGVAVCPSSGLPGGGACGVELHDGASGAHGREQPAVAVADHLTARRAPRWGG